MEEKTRDYFKYYGMEDKIIKLKETSATVKDAAAAIGVEVSRIAKTICLRKNDTVMLLVTSGDTVIDNKKFKDTFHEKARMMPAEEVTKYTGHTIGSVCPFAIPEDIEVYIDESVKRFESVYPSCGSVYQVINLAIDELYKFSNATSWVDVCKIKE